MREGAGTCTSPAHQPHDEKGKRDEDRAAKIAITEHSAVFEKKLVREGRRELKDRRLEGYLDLFVKSKEVKCVFEFKCVQKLEVVHEIQLALYAYLNELAVIEEEQKKARAELRDLFSSSLVGISGGDEGPRPESLCARLKISANMVSLISCTGFVRRKISANMALRAKFIHDEEISEFSSTPSNNPCGNDEDDSPKRPEVDFSFQQAPAAHRDTRTSAATNQNVAHLVEMCPQLGPAVVERILAKHNDSLEAALTECLEVAAAAAVPVVVRPPRPVGNQQAGTADAASSSSLPASSSCSRPAPVAPPGREKKRPRSCQGRREDEKINYDKAKTEEVIVIPDTPSSCSNSRPATPVSSVPDEEFCSRPPTPSSGSPKRKRVKREEEDDIREDEDASVGKKLLLHGRAKKGDSQVDNDEENDDEDEDEHALLYGVGSGVGGAEEEDEKSLDGGRRQAGGGSGTTKTTGVEGLRKKNLLLLHQGCKSVRDRACPRDGHQQTRRAGRRDTSPAAIPAARGSGVQQQEEDQVCSSTTLSEQANLIQRSAAHLFPEMCDNSATAGKSGSGSGASTSSMIVSNCVFDSKLLAKILSTEPELRKKTETFVDRFLTGGNREEFFWRAEEREVQFRYLLYNILTDELLEITAESVGKLVQMTDYLITKKYGAAETKSDAEFLEHIHNISKPYLDDL
ncbi:unnamed protein product [Amoebophrya sp. A120]|nr:unnamed protein product [Amoebophrya sp. A120]|eukprot:GSA120T00020802001.1